MGGLAQGKSEPLERGEMEGGGRKAVQREVGLGKFAVCVGGGCTGEAHIVFSGLVLPFWSPPSRLPACLAVTHTRTSASLWCPAAR